MLQDFLSVWQFVLLSYAVLCCDVPHLSCAVGFYLCHSLLCCALQCCAVLCSANVTQVLYSSSPKYIALPLSIRHRAVLVYTFITQTMIARSSIFWSCYHKQGSAVRSSCRLSKSPHCGHAGSALSSVPAAAASYHMFCKSSSLIQPQQLYAQLHA